MLVDARNMADGLVFGAQKALSELGEDVPAETRSDVESVTSELSDAIKGDDIEIIKTKAQALSEAVQPLAELMQSKADAENSDEIIVEAEEDEDE
jgi:molecular chaperone DnaK